MQHTNSSDGAALRGMRTATSVAKLAGGWQFALIVAALIILLVFSAPFVFFFQWSTDYSNIGGSPTSKAQQEIPQDLLPIYISAAKRYGVPWQVLASIHKQETSFGRTTLPGDPKRKKMISSVGAKGPMQFTDETWKDFGVDGDGDGKADVWDEDDAIFSAANMLRQTLDQNGGDLRKAVLRYNHSRTYADQVLARAQAYATPATQTVALPGSGKVIFPLPPPYRPNPTSPFGYRRHPVTGEIKFHEGTDFGAAMGTPVMAAGGGVVTRAGWASGYGNLIEIDHGSFSTRYGHLSKIYVAPGQAVPQGAIIGAVGSTGRSTGPHLHFEVRVNGKPIDPMTVINRAVAGKQQQKPQQGNSGKKANEKKATGGNGNPTVNIPNSLNILDGISD